MQPINDLWFCFFFPFPFPFVCFSPDPPQEEVVRHLIRCLKQRSSSACHTATAQPRPLKPIPESLWKRVSFARHSRAARHLLHLKIFWGMRSATRFKLGPPHVSPHPNKHTQTHTVTHIYTYFLFCSVLLIFLSYLLTFFWCQKWARSCSHKKGATWSGACSNPAVTDESMFCVFSFFHFFCLSSSSRRNAQSAQSVVRTFSHKGSGRLSFLVQPPGPVEHRVDCSWRSTGSFILEIRAQDGTFALCSFINCPSKNVRWFFIFFFLFYFFFIVPKKKKKSWL